MANKSDFEGLSINEMRAIADLVESRAWEVLQKVVKLRRDALGGQLLSMYTDKGDQLVNRTQGKAEGQRELIVFLKAVNKHIREKDSEEKTE